MNVFLNLRNIKDNHLILYCDKNKWQNLYFSIKITINKYNKYICVYI